MEKILIVSNYYPPEKGAAANRIEQLALKLHQNKYEVTVLCPLANYPKGELFKEYKGKISVTENRGGITVKRLWVYPSVSKNILIRVISVMSFVLGLFFYLLFKKTPQKVVIQSPPLLVSFVSILVLSFKKKKIILNVSDLWPLAAIEIKALKENSISHKVSLFFEKYIYKKATVVLAQSHEIINHVKTIVPHKTCYLYRNFPEHSHSQVQTTSANTQEADKPIKIFYAGLLGIAQGIAELCKKIDLSHLNVEWHIFGDGAEKNEILAFIEANTASKIVFHGMIERNKLHDMLKDFDIALVPLKTRIYGSVPSKIFEYAALGFPILYFGGGEGEDIVNKHKLGWVVPVENYVQLNVQLREISLLDRQELSQIKKDVFDTAKNNFNLQTQVKNLIESDVF